MPRSVGAGLSFAPDDDTQEAYAPGHPSGAVFVFRYSGLIRGGGYMTFTSLMGFDIDEASPYAIGVVGHGPVLDVLSRFMKSLDLTAAFPQVRLVGWVPGESPVPSGIPQALLSRTRYDDVAALVAACPGIRAIFDLSPDCRHIPAIRAAAPLNATVGTSEMVLRFCASVHDGRLSMGGTDGNGKTQKLFGLLVDQIDGDMLILDERGVIVDVNHHAADSRGLRRRDMIGKPCADFDRDGSFCFHTEECPFVQARESGKTAERTFDQTLESGHVRYLYLVCIPVTDAFGGPTQYMYIRRDVTEQQRLHKLLEMQEKDAALGRLTLYLAHEIRNPLFAIGGFANALFRTGSLDDSAREKAKIIVEESRRLDVILAKILNFAKSAEQAIGEFNPEDVMRQCLDLMGIGKDESGSEVNRVKVEVELEPHLPMVRGNAENVRDSLNNMIKNSLEAMPEGGTLSLSARRNNGYVLIEVRDTGRGIPPELQEQVFNPFFSTKEGMGLGLAMSRKLVEEMGGKVLLESSSGEGTRISLLMPVALATETTDDTGGENGAGVKKEPGTASALYLIRGSGRLP